MELDRLLRGPAQKIKGGQCARLFVAMNAGEDGELEAKAWVQRLGDDFRNEGAALDFGRGFTQHEITAAGERTGDVAPGISEK
jgi:hypothetical protein